MGPGPRRDGAAGRWRAAAGADQFLVDIAWAGSAGSILLDAFPTWPGDPEACPADLVL